MKFKVFFIAVLFLVVIGLCALYFLIRQRNSPGPVNTTGLVLYLLSERRPRIILPEALYPEVQEVFLAKPELFAGMSIQFTESIPPEPLAGSFVLNAEGLRDSENVKYAYKFVTTPQKPLQVIAYIHPDESPEDVSYYVNEIIATTILQFSEFTDGRSSLDAIKRASDIMQARYPNQMMVEL